MYGAGSYTVNEPYKKFLVQSNEWYSWSNSKRRNHVNKFGQYVPCMTDRFPKPKTSGRKPTYKNRHRSMKQDVFNDRHMETETRTALDSGAFTTLIQGEETMRLTDPG